ncbi:uncharacterized protein LOC111783470 [Cucurbita pepo subsp. pepo]|uniref:uncharacterized protein LOC111783470 n=1 Tax=Cucurbita pepo subsp. pepo TaxID=3664 RepID=UPI000C9D731E|nr:uncharacterized protein LOC111783470 [Cucurbita pepo subsp. pepo]
MNASLNSGMVFSEDIADGSDSDTNSAEGSDYYEPISVIDGEESDEAAGSDDETYSSDTHLHHLPNGFRVENAVSSLSLNDDVERRCSDEEEEESMREASDSAIRMAFREDETRRNAPLSPENATRIMEAMRGISFGGSAPDWTRIVSEDRWIDQLRRLRQTPTSPNNFGN